MAGTPATGVVAAAYTNNDADPNTATTLFDVDASLDQLAIQAPPNNGSLNPTGKLGVDVSSPAGADIYSRVKNGTTVQNTAFAALGVGGRSAFFGVDVLTGRCVPEGMVPGGLADHGHRRPDDLGLLRRSAGSWTRLALSNCPRKREEGPGGDRGL